MNIRTNSVRSFPRKILILDRIFILYWRVKEICERKFSKYFSENPSFEGVIRRCCSFPRGKEMAITHLFPHFSSPIRAMNNGKYGLPSFETLFPLVVRSGLVPVIFSTKYYRPR